MGDNENLVASLQKRLEENSKVSSIVVHDLRNPLASMRMYFEMALSDNQALKDHSESLKEPILKMCRTMSLLLDNYSDFANIDGECTQMKRSQCDLAQLVTGAREACSDLIDRAGVKVDFSPDYPVFSVRLDRGLFSKMLHKLFGEVVLLAPHCSGVEVALGREGEDALLNITYQSDWNRQDLQSLLDISLLKLKEEKNSDQRILGLVFAIVKKILAAHGFPCRTIELSSGGVDMQIRLPGA